MALTRFVETYSAAARYCEHINSTPELRERYKEAIARSTIPGVQKLTERAANGEEIDLYRFPISRFDHKNQNKRLYPRALWERVIRDQQHEWKERVGLADHPGGDEDGEFKNAAIVWLDMEIDDANKLIWAIGTFVGAFGALAKDIISKGGRIGFSSSGFGELMRDKETVDPESFVLERCADIVLNPSQDVFGEAGDALNTEYSPQKVEGNKTFVQHESVRIKENRMDQKDTTSTGEAEKVTPISSLEEKKFRRDVSRYIEDAGKMESPQARLAELTDILGFFNEGAAPDLRATVESKILEEKAELEKLCGEAQKVQETFGMENTESLKMGVALLAEEVKVASAEAKDWEKIALALKENNQKLREALEATQKELATRPTVHTLENVSKRVEFLEAQRRRQLFAYNEETKALEEQLKEARATSATSSQKLVEAKTDNQRIIQDRKALEERIRIAEKVCTDRKTMIERIGTEKASYDTLLAEANATIKTLTGQIDRLQEALEEEKKETEEVKESFETYKQEILESNTPKLQSRFADREDVRGRLNFNENGGLAVERYWTDLLSRYGESILPYERQIRTCKTYREASVQFFKIQSLIDESSQAVERSRLPESVAISKAERLEALQEAGMNYGNEKGVLDRNKSWAQ